jgi:hypothetical protein
VGIGILGISSKDEIVKLSREGTEKTKDGDLDARGIRFSKLVKAGGGTGRTVTTMARTTFATGLDLVLPMGPEDNGIGGTSAGSAIHAEGVELITLFVLGGMPKRPGREGLEFASG